MLSPQASAGSIDYLSLTLRESALVETMHRAGQHLLNLEVAKGFDLATGALHGYELQRAGGIQVGRSGSGVWISLIGEYAAKHYHRFSHFGAQCTRVDLALTAQFTPPLRLHIENQYYDSTPPRAPASRRKYALILSDHGGATLYVGSRKSDQFGRLYDRGVKAQISPPGTLLRWEVEYKGAKAQALYSYLTMVQPSSTILSGLVGEWFRTRQVDTPTTDRTNVLEVGTVARVPTVDDKLEWMRQQVSPSVKRLIDLGYIAQLIEALGISRGGK